MIVVVTVIVVVIIVVVVVVVAITAFHLQQPLVRGPTLISRS